LSASFLGGLDRFLLGLLGQFLAGGLLQGLDELLLVLEGADVVFFLGRDEGLAFQARVVHARLQFVQQLDHVLLGHVEGDALGLGHLLEFDDRQVLKPARRDLFQLYRQLLGLFQRRLFFSQELDQLLLGPQQADLVFFQLCLQCGPGEVRMVEPRFDLVQQLDEVCLGAGDGDAVLLGQRLELFHGEGVQVRDLAALEGCLELGVFRGFRLCLLFDGLGWKDARRGFGRRLGPQLPAAYHQGPGHHTGAATVGMGGLLRETTRVKDLAVQRAADRADPLVLHGHPLELLDSDLPVELDPSLVVGAQHLGPGDDLHAVLGLAEHLGAGMPE